MGSLIHQCLDLGVFIGLGFRLCLGEDSKNAIGLSEGLGECLANSSRDALAVEGGVDFPKQRVEGAEGLGGVEVVSHSLPEVHPELIDVTGAQAAVTFCRRCVVQPSQGVGDPFQGLLGRVKTVEGEVELLAVGDRQQQVSNDDRIESALQQLPEREEIALGLGHLFSVDGQVFRMEPVAGKGLAGGGFGLGDLVLVVGEDIVDPTRVDIQGFAQETHGHRRAFEVPAGASAADLGLPGGLVLLGPLPKHKVPGIVLLVFVRVHPGAGQVFVQSYPRELAIGREGRDSVVDRVAGTVGMAALVQRLDQLGHLIDIVGRPGVVLGPLDPQSVEVFEECLDIPVCELPQGQPDLVGTSNRLVVDVGQVHHLGHAPAEELECPSEDVLEEKGPQIPDVGKVINRGTAGIETGMTLLETLERFKPPSQGVVEMQTNVVHDGLRRGIVAIRM